MHASTLHGFKWNSIRTRSGAACSAHALRDLFMNSIKRLPRRRAAGRKAVCSAAGTCMKCAGSGIVWLDYTVRPRVTLCACLYAPWTGPAEWLAEWVGRITRGAWQTYSWCCYGYSQISIPNICPYSQPGKTGVLEQLHGFRVSHVVSSDFYNSCRFISVLYLH